MEFKIKTFYKITIPSRLFWQFALERPDIENVATPQLLAAESEFKMQYKLRVRWDSLEFVEIEGTEDDLLAFKYDLERFNPYNRISKPKGEPKTLGEELADAVKNAYAANARINNMLTPQMQAPAPAAPAGPASTGAPVFPWNGALAP